MQLKTMETIKWKTRPDKCYCCRTYAGVYRVGIKDRSADVMVVVCGECVKLEPSEIVAMMEGGIINEKEI